MAGRRIHDQHDDVDLLERIEHEPHHAFVQSMERLVNSRCVEKYDLSFSIGHDAANNVACGLRPGSNDRYLLADQPVEQR